MLFDYSLDQKEIKTFNLKSFLHLFSDNKWYFLIASVCAYLLVLGNAVIAIVLCFVGCVSVYGYVLGKELTEMSFIHLIDDFNLTDVIDDLER